jgi:hypothetical protein
MTYIRVKWIHSFSNEPVLLYSELDRQGWEQRKVEIFADGSMGYADANTSSMGTKLSEETIPTLIEISADPQFQPEEICGDEFELVWAKAIERSAK